MKDSNAMRIGILGATFETGNMGVGALAAGAVTCILSQFSDASIFFLDYAKEATERTVVIAGKLVCVPLVNMRFSRRFYLSNNIIVLLLVAILLKFFPLPGMRKWITRRNKCLFEICEANLFVSVAGGDSFSDIYGLGRLFYVSLPQILIIALGKRLILLPQTYGPFQRRSSRLIAKFIVNHSERAFCRDHRSLDQLMGTTGASNQNNRSAFCHDMAFCIDSVAPADLTVEGIPLLSQRDMNLVGLNVSGLLYRGGNSGRNAFGLRVDYRNLVPDIIDLLIQEKNASVLLVPHVFETEEGFESDVVACELIYSVLKSKYSGQLGILRGLYDQNEIRYVIGRCGFFVGSRMHACIAAVSQQIPAVAIAYSDKFLGVMETVGIESMTVDARKLDYDQILSALSVAFKNRGRVEAELQKTIPQIRETVRHLFCQIEGLAHDDLTPDLRALEMRAQ
jgi:colanic acid/amylovoran biosynthesis protein